METAESARARSNETHTKSPRFYVHYIERAIDERIKAAIQCGNYNIFFACDLLPTNPDTREKHAEAIVGDLRSRGFRVHHVYNSSTGHLFLTVDWSESSE